MSVFLSKIQINKVFHLHNVLIELDDNKKKHLILTGKNGSGKSSLLLAIAGFLQKIKNDPSLAFFTIEDSLRKLEEQIAKRKLTGETPHNSLEEITLKSYKETLERWLNEVKLEIHGLKELSEKLKAQNFLLSYYSAVRTTKVIIPRNPEKPNLLPSPEIGSSKTSEFIKFLIDLKVQEALARNEKQNGEADEIKKWFENFTVLLSNLFEGDAVSLDFNYKDYSFTIDQNGRQFGFNQLSDGYSAVIDIIADLIIKMQSQDTLTRAYEMEGIVLIDEIETHLHLKLQRLILPMLTQIFPNIQFILTTHSPFVLSSIPNAVAFDLEKGTRLENLTEYSYEALAEGYFKVETDSVYLIAKLDRFKELSEISEKDAAELEEYQNLDQEFSSMDGLLTAPNIKGQYLQIKLSSK